MYHHRRDFAMQGRRPHRIKYFDPSVLVKNAATNSPAAPKPSFQPKNSFKNLGFAPLLLKNIAEKSFTTLTPIQDEVIPLLNQGYDVVGLASTGSGKTAAFLLPMIQKVLTDRKQKVLIMTPTRELAIQIDNELRLLTKELRIYSAVCIGGMGINGQIYKLRQQPNFVIGTPGRLTDLASLNTLRLREYRNVILDEVDRILDMGFVKDMTEILRILPIERQSAFFSATITPGVKHIMNRFLRNPVNIAIKANTTVESVEQQIVRTNGKNRVEVLHNLLIQPGFDKVLVFGRTKHGLDKLEDDLIKRGFKVSAIHGNKSQGQRQRALNEFKNNFVKILLATDIASRGLDIANVTHVINYDLPESYEDYIHRIGRTGRANKTGIALTIVG